jgi:hypothetical protein
MKAKRYKASFEKLYKCKVDTKLLSRKGIVEKLDPSKEYPISENDVYHFLFLKEKDMAIELKIDGVSIRPSNKTNSALVRNHLWFRLHEIDGVDENLLGRIDSECMYMVYMALKNKTHTPEIFNGKLRELVELSTTSQNTKELLKNALTAFYHDG